MNKENKRILLKLSGEALKGSSCDDVFDKEVLKNLCGIIKDLHESSIEIGVVIGGGNIFRGRVCKAFSIDRINADYMGMTATNINALMVTNILVSMGVKAKCLSSLLVEKTCERYSKAKANKYLKQGYVVIFAGGTGKPLFSTDTAAALRAHDIGDATILAGKHGTDGVYDSDPNTNKDAKKYDVISYDEFIEKKLNALDIDAIKVCKKHNIEVRVFNMDDINNIKIAVNKDDYGTIIRKG